MSQKDILTSETLETPQDHSQTYKSFFGPKVSRCVYRRKFFLRNTITLHHLNSKVSGVRIAFSHNGFFNLNEKLLGNNCKRHPLGNT